MHTSKSYYAIYVKFGKGRKEILKVTRNLPNIRKQYKTKEEAEAAVTERNIGDDVRQWLEVSETIDLFWL